MVNAGSYPPPPPMPPPGGYGATPPPPSGSNKSKIGLILGIVGGVLLLGCLICGGIGYFIFSFGMGEFEKEVRRRVETHPKMIEHIGTISTFKWQFMESQRATEQRGQPNVAVFVFAVTGSKGTGSVKAVQMQGVTGIAPFEARLEMGGQTYLLIGEGAEEEEGGIQFAPSGEMNPED